MPCRMEHGNITVRDMEQAVRFITPALPRYRIRLQWEFIQYLSDDPAEKNHYD